MRNERINLREVLRLVEDELLLVEALLGEHVRSDVPLMREMARYVQDGGGKRIRPALLLMAAGLCGVNGERVRQLAVVIEYIHTATLLHDDIIDDAMVRRGRRSANSRWGNDATVLLGDFLYARSMALALAQENLPILRLLSDVTQGMVEGEMLEIERRNDGAWSEKDHIRIIERKTANLFSACTAIGAILGGESSARRKALAEYGFELGVCFQMVDDLLDFIGDEAVLGKPVASDLREGKLTLPAIYLKERGGAQAAEMLQMVVADQGYSRIAREDIVRLAHAHGAIDEARRMAETRARASRRALQVFPCSKYRDALLMLPDYVLERMY
jgi:octaprenyl-diphosphate synthase